MEIITTSQKEKP